MTDEDSEEVSIVFGSDAASEVEERRAWSPVWVMDSPANRVAAESAPSEYDSRVVCVSEVPVAGASPPGTAPVQPEPVCLRRQPDPVDFQKPPELVRV